MHNLVTAGIVRKANAMNVIAANTCEQLRQTIRMDIDGALFYSEQRPGTSTSLSPINATQLEDLTRGWSDMGSLQPIINGAEDIRADADNWSEQV